MSGNAPLFWSADHTDLVLLGFPAFGSKTWLGKDQTFSSLLSVKVLNRRSKINTNPNIDGLYVLRKPVRIFTQLELLMFAAGANTTLMYCKQQDSSS